MATKVKKIVSNEEDNLAGATTALMEEKHALKSNDAKHDVNASKGVDSPFNENKNAEEKKTATSKSNDDVKTDTKATNANSNGENTIKNSNNVNNVSENTNTKSALSEKERNRITKDNAKREAKWQKKEMYIWIDECKKYIEANLKAKQAFESMGPEYVNALKNNQISLSMALKLYSAIEQKMAPEHGNHYYSKTAVSNVLGSVSDESLADQIKVAERLFKRHVAYAAMEDKFVLDYVKESDKKLYEKIHKLHDESISYIGYADYRKNGSISNLSFEESERKSKMKRKDWIKLYSMVRKFEIKDSLPGLAILFPPGTEMASEHKASKQNIDNEIAKERSNSKETMQSSVTNTAASKPKTEAKIEVEHVKGRSSEGVPAQTLIYKKLSDGTKILLDKINAAITSIGKNGKKLDASLSNGLKNKVESAEKAVDNVLKSLKEFALSVSKLGSTIKSGLKSTKKAKQTQIQDEDNLNEKMGISKEEIPIVVPKVPIHNVRKKHDNTEVKNNEILRPPGVGL